MSLLATGAILGASALASLLSKNKNKDNSKSVGSQLGDVAVQGIGQFASGALNEYYNKRAQDRGIQASMQLMREQQIAQNQNNLNAGMMMRSSKERAGFNINADGSISPSLTPPTATQNALPTNSSGMSLLPLSQVDLNEAQARDLNATAGLKERKLKGENEADELFSIGKQTIRGYETSDGLIEIEVFNERDKHVSTREGFEAVKDYTRWLKKDLPEINASQIKAFLDREVFTQQFQNNKIVKAISELPVAEIEKLKQDKLTSIALQGLYIQEGKLQIEQTALTKIQKDLADMDKTERENSSIGQLLHKIDVSIDNKDILGFLGSLFKLLFVSALNVVNVGIGGQVSSVRYK